MRETLRNHRNIKSADLRVLTSCGNYIQPQNEEASEEIRILIFNTVQSGVQYNINGQKLANASAFYEHIIFYIALQLFKLHSRIWNGQDDNNFPKITCFENNRWHWELQKYEMTQTKISVCVINP